MNSSLTSAQLEIREGVDKVCARFGDDYWLERDTDGEFPHAFHKALADAGWLGIAMPEAYGGSGLGITEAAIMMQTIAQSGAAFSGASAVHMNIFGLNPVVVFG
ncbi:MAG TPA: acyl-CoA dehydrogenase family protein, partial [Hyphomicrobiaceae bacterium]